MRENRREALSRSQKQCCRDSGLAAPDSAEPMLHLVRPLVAIREGPQWMERDAEVTGLFERPAFLRRSNYQGRKKETRDGPMRGNMTFFIRISCYD